METAKHSRWKAEIAGLYNKTKEQDPPTGCLQETHLKYENTHLLQVGGWRGQTSRTVWC